MTQHHNSLTTIACVVQRVFASLYQEGAAAGSGEDAELLFAHLSAAAHTTRNMGEAGKHNHCSSTRQVLVICASLGLIEMPCVMIWR